jgi:pimeloyl-ACP methyl ester carboxylesterase
MRISWAYLALIPLLLGDWAAAATADPSRVEITLGTRETSLGDRIEYALLTPSAQLHPDPPPYPALVLSHGFARDYGRHIGNAAAFASDGIIVLAPNLVESTTRPMVGSDAAANLVDHVRWLISRNDDHEDPLAGMLDPDRIVLAGHSAGGAASLTAVATLQQHGIRPAALVLLDAVPDLLALKSARRLRSLPLLSIRSDPNACNANGLVERLEASLRFPIESTWLSGATHCDPETPTDIVCQLACGGSSEVGRASYRALTQEFLRRALGLTSALAPSAGR